MKNLIYVVIAFAFAGCSTPPPPASEAPSLPVVKTNTGDATIYQLYPASIEGRDNVEIRPQVSGILENIFVDEGAYVHLGQPLFQIDERPFLQRLNNAKANLRSASGALASANLEVEKLTPLVAGKVVSDYQLKTAESARETALGNVEQAQADMATAKINLGYTLIKAPSNGYISRLFRKKGSLVSQTDGSPLTDLSDVSDVHIYFSLAEYDFIQFKSQYPGKTLQEKIAHLPLVDLILANDSAYESKGRIDLIDGQFDKNTGAITVRATFPNPNGLLRSGNTGRVRLGLKLSNQLIVPQSATSELQDQTFVFVVDEHNKVSKVPIVISGRSGTDYLVRGGLKAGDRIVLSGSDQLHEGDVITPQPANNKNTHQFANN